MKLTKSIVLLLVSMSLALCLIACSDSNVDLVKRGNFPGYDTVTIAKLLDSALTSGKWSSENSSKNELLVTFKGRLTTKIHEAAVKELGITRENASTYIYHSDIHNIKNSVPKAIPKAILDEADRLLAEDQKYNYSDEQKQMKYKICDEMRAVFAKCFFAPGSEITIRWVILSNGTQFKLYDWQGDTVPQWAKFNVFLKMLYQS